MISEIYGDPRYIAPEQALNSNDLNYRTNMYTTSMNLFEVLNGRHPFQDLIGSHHERLLTTQCTRKMDPIGKLLPNLPMDIRYALNVIISKTCAKDPTDQFESTTALRTALLKLH